MSTLIRLVVVTTALVLAGCGDSQRSEPISQRRTERDGSRPRVMGERIERFGEDSSTLTSREAGTTGDAGNGEDLVEFREQVRNGSAVIVDARSPEHFSAGHVRGAINIPAGREDSYIEKFSRDVARDQLVVVYCDNRWCHSSDKVQEFLQEQGFMNVKVFHSGWQKLASERDLLE